jgi:hypothetical protein
MEKKSLSVERRFLDDLQKKVTVKRVAKEIQACKKELSSSCRYITRVIYHLLPEFREESLDEELMELFKSTKTTLYDLHLLTGDKNAQSYKAVVEMIKQEAHRGDTR